MRYLGYLWALAMKKLKLQKICYYSAALCETTRLDTRLFIPRCQELTYASSIDHPSIHVLFCFAELDLELRQSGRYVPST